MNQKHEPCQVLELAGVSKRFGATLAVDGVSFAVQPGEFFSLLGPSGCGKTTTLRLIAGFEQPERDGGTIRIGTDVVNDRRPYERPLSMVFQNYALFPHLSVDRNIRFGLEQRRVPPREIADRVAQAMDLVHLDPGKFARRRPHELSGGQRQRVALARALILQPDLLLLDEPLGALDLKLRRAMQSELRRLNRELGLTFLYVTHDQGEALAMSDRIAVMDRGRVVQVGTPAELYEQPQSLFVARFLGESNLFEGTFRADAGHPEVAARNGATFHLPPGSDGGGAREVRLVVRPEWLHLAAPGSRPAGYTGVLGMVEDLEYLGDVIRVRVRTPACADAVVVAVPNPGGGPQALPWQPGVSVDVHWRPERGRLVGEAS